MRTIVFLAALALAGCSGREEPAAVASESAAPAPVETTTAEPAKPAAPPAVAAIPAALRGRWGLVPGDCTSTRGDAKGLLTIDAAGLRFFESAGKLGKVAEAGPNSLRASFAMQGEGMEWTRDMALEVEGNTLKRREFGPEASAEGFVYTRC